MCAFGLSKRGASVVLRCSGATAAVRFKKLPREYDVDRDRARFKTHAVNIYTHTRRTVPLAIHPTTTTHVRLQRIFAHSRVRVRVEIVKVSFLLCVNSVDPVCYFVCVYVCCVFVSVCA